jgi:hypothetical protein
MEFKKIISIASILTVTLFSHQIFAKNILKNITVVNESAVKLLPTAEGFLEGCVGGSLPPLFEPVIPHTTRNVDLVFISYFPNCQFDVLPMPNIMTYLQACHAVKEHDVVTFTGNDLLSLRCQVTHV